MSKDIVFSQGARNRLLSGIEKLTNAVSVTMGPKGRNVLIQNSFGAPKLTKDGVTVAKAVELFDNIENLGAGLIKDVANKVNESAGDGTTTATVLSHAIFQEGCKHVSSGRNPTDILTGINIAVKKVIEFIEKRKLEIKSSEDIYSVSKISANGDEVIAKMISDAFSAVGSSGCVTINEGNSLEHELEVREGYLIKRGWVSPLMVMDHRSQTAELNNCDVVIIERKLSDINTIVPILEDVLNKNREVLIIAEDFSSDVTSTLILNRVRAGLKCVAVKAPGFGTNRVETLKDIAAVVNGKVIGEKTSSDNILTYVGAAEKVKINKDETIILTETFRNNKNGTNENLKERILDVKEHKNRCEPGYEMEKVEERLSALLGGVAVIKVGGRSDLEVSEAKDRYEDSLNAAKAAMRGGIIPGGGTALLYATKCLEEEDRLNDDIQVGVDIVKAACRRPLKVLVDNAGGAEGGLISNKLLTEGKWGFGYDVYNSVYCDLLESGIIDPCQVVTTALLNAASVSGLLITTESTIVQKKTSKTGDILRDL